MQAIPAWRPTPGLRGTIVRRAVSGQGKGLVHGCLRGRDQVPVVDRMYRTLLAYLADKL